VLGRLARVNSSCSSSRHSASLTVKRPTDVVTYL
jgi:hypothetical protein